MNQDIKKTQATLCMDAENAALYDGGYACLPKDLGGEEMEPIFVVHLN